jgi:hypothetical protein
MKRAAIALGIMLLVSILGTGLWWSLRRQPAGSILDDEPSAFKVVAEGPGQLITFQEAQIPLRSFRWLPPMPGGALVAQVLSQNDRQRVALFQDGIPQNLLLVEKPLGVGDGFWRFAQLKQAAQAAGGTLVLLYQPGEASSAELPLVLALDVASQQVRWACRSACDHLAVSQGSEAVFLFGGKAPVQRVELNPPAGAASLRPQVKSIELPPEIPEVEDLLPTGAWSFLVSHRNGLSAYQAKPGWTHFPAPEDRGVPCQNWRSSLVRNGKDIWWQAVPGRLVKIGADGRTLTTWQTDLGPDPFARDARLLRLLGADPAGALWFTLASPDPAALTPQPPQPQDDGAPPASAEGAEGAEGPEAQVPVPDPNADWAPYLAQGLDRVYRWDPVHRTLERVLLGKDAWNALHPPATVEPPAPGRGLVPSAGALLAEGPRCCWWLPLAALPAQRVQAM